MAKRSRKSSEVGLGELGVIAMFVILLGAVGFGASQFRPSNTFRASSGCGCGR